jgi:hypothetical protein
MGGRGWGWAGAGAGGGAVGDGAGVVFLPSLALPPRHPATPCTLCAPARTCLGWGVEEGVMEREREYGCARSSYPYPALCAAYPSQLPTPTPTPLQHHQGASAAALPRADRGASARRAPCFTPMHVCSHVQPSPTPSSEAAPSCLRPLAGVRQARRRDTRPPEGRPCPAPGGGRGW